MRQLRGSFTLEIRLLYSQNEAMNDDSNPPPYVHVICIVKDCKQSALNLELPL